MPTTGSSCPHVVLRLKYYEPGGKGRDFYSSSKKDDYVGYVDKGIRQVTAHEEENDENDYIAYAGNKEKSSGIFDDDGLIDEEKKKVLRNNLRKTQSVIWDCVISFEEKYGKDNCGTPEKARKLLQKVLPPFFKSIGLDPKKTVWYAGLHENTDNRHIHLSFFQTGPTVYDRKTKGRKYRHGKVPLKSINAMKMSIERNYMTPVEGAARVRKLLVDESRRIVSENFEKDKGSLGIMCRAIYEKIPTTGELAYESPNMDCVRDDVDALTNLIIEKGFLSVPYKKLLKEADERDQITKFYCERNHINPEGLLYKPKFAKDMKRRVGNAIIKELVSKKGEERILAMRLHHPKAIQRLHQKSCAALFDQALYFAQRAADIAWDAYLDYQETLRALEKARKETEKENEDEAEMD
jgi:hypothetical protein